MNIFKGYITDLDGTLCDTLEANIASYDMAFQDAKIKFDRKKYVDNFGLRFDKMMEFMAPDASLETLHTIKTRKALHYKNNLHLINPNDLLIDTLKHVKANGLKIARVSTASRENAINILNHISISEDFFDVTVFGEDVVNGKPNPECYHVAIKRLGFQPAECIILEDTDTGIAAAKASGAKVLKVTI